MEENNKPIIDRDTLIPISLLITVITLAVGGAWFISALSSQVNKNAENIQVIVAKMADYPTRREFEQMQYDLTEIKRDVKELISKK